MIYYIRDEEGSLIGIKYNHDIYYYIKNMQEDIIGITDNNYNIICRYEYDSWGKVITIKDNNGNIIIDESHIGIINPYRYRSYYYDKETKLYYLNSRYYNPEWGRFINTDRYVISSYRNFGLNLYCYVDNNFINKTDSKDTNPIRLLAKLAWKGVNKVLRTIGMTKSAELLEHSIQKKPSDLRYNKNSDFSKSIKNDKNFKEVMSNVTKNNPNTNFVDYTTRVTFSDKDLVGSLHEATLIINGYTENGVGNYNITVYDKYDFKWEWFKEFTLENIALTIGNNLAYGDQITGLINNYNVYVDLDYGNVEEGAVCLYR